MLWETDVYFLWSDVLKSFAEGPSILAHEKGGEHDETSIVAWCWGYDAAERLFFSLFYKFFQLSQFFEILVPEFMSSFFD